MGARGHFSIQIMKAIIGFILVIHTAEATRRHDFRVPVKPTPEALLQIADAAGAAKFEELPIDALGDPNSPIAKTALDPDANVEYHTYQGVMGRPGIDFPVYPSIPNTGFNCKKVPNGYYADLETECQVFHICDGGRKISFLCPKGTIFRQSHLICDWWFKVDCNGSPELYEESAEHLAEDQRKRDRANRQPSNTKNFDVLTSQKRIHNNHLSGIQSSNEYKAEASFTSVAQSGAPAEINNQNRERNQNSKKVQNGQARHRSNFEMHSDSNANNNAKYSATRRSMVGYTDSTVYRSTTQPSRTIKETQIAEESASFASNRGKNNFFQFSTIVDNRKTPTVQSSTFAQPKTTRATYSTSYVPGTKNYVEVTRSVSQSTSTTKAPVTSSHIFSSSFRTTETPPQSTEKQNYPFSFVQYTQFPTTSAPHNHFKITTNHTTFRRGKAFSSQKVDETLIPNKTLTRNTYSLVDKNKNNNVYTPTVPTVVPKLITTTTTYRPYASTLPNNEESLTTISPTSYVNEPAVSEHAIDMLKTLEELEALDSEPTTESDKFFGKRPGLLVPPSAGPNTLHSLAIYFATAVDNLVSTVAPTSATEQQLEEATEPEIITEDNKQLLLSKHTLDKYSDLFKNNTEEEDFEETPIEEDVSNDLDLQQSQGPLSSSPQIRELAQVFTHALSAYLQDPETFRKVLSEIRPTEPTPYVDVPTTKSSFIEDTTLANDFASVTKEEDEVLDFSDVSKTSSKLVSSPTYETTYDSKKTTFEDTQTTASYQQSVDRTPGSRFITQGRFDTPSETKSTASNPVAEEINGGLTFGNEKLPQIFAQESNNSAKSEEFDVDSSYFPVQSEGEPLPKYGGFQNNSAENSSRYGAGVRPNNSAPISTTQDTFSEIQAVPLHWGDVISTRITSTSVNDNTPSFDLLPPQNNKLDSVEMSVLNSFVPEDLNDLAVINRTENEYTTDSIIKETVTPKYQIYNTDSDIYKSDHTTINDNDEQLQRAHSQSFVSSKNQLGRRGKNIKNQSQNKNDNDFKEDKSGANNSTVTVRTSNGQILSLPTLKDILSKPTSLSYTVDASTASTTVDDVSTISTEEPTTNFDISTTENYVKATTKVPSSAVTQNIWSTSSALAHLWQTTVYLDPMTINDGLTGDISSETIQPSANTYFPNAGIKNWNTTPKPAYDSSTVETSQYSTYTTPISTIQYDDYTTVSPQEDKKPDLPSLSLLLENEYFDQFKRNNQPTPVTVQKDRGSKSLKHTSIDSLQKLNASDVDQTMMTKAKEMFGGLNASSANTLMNVMKQADKNTTVRRLILLLIQTCDDDHNKTLEASRTALLDALIRLPTEETHTTVSQNQFTDNLEITGQYLDQTTPSDRQDDEIIDTEDTKHPDLIKFSERRGKSLYVEQTTLPEIIETTTEIPTTTTTTPTTTVTTTTTTTTTTTEKPTTSLSSSTSSAPVVTIRMGRRGNRKYIVKSTKTPINRSQQTFGADFYSSGEKGSTVSLEDQSVPSDTRALELLRSLYSLAARWG